MIEVLSFLLQYKAIIIFYLIIIVFLIIKRKELDIQSKFIVLYRLKFGLKLIEKISQKFREWIVLLGYIGVGIGFIGLVAISWVLVKNLYDLIATPSTLSGISLVLPGINVPGMGVLPFWYWLIAIFLIAVIHEFSHGIVARAHNVKVKNTGIFFLGPIIGAFVEPNENILHKEKDVVQYSVLAAGSFSNILLAIVALLALTFVFQPLETTMVNPTGFTFDFHINSSYPLAQAGLAPGTLITGINGQKTLEFQSFNDELTKTKPGEKIVVNTPEKNYEIVLAASPDNPNNSFLGISSIKNEFATKEQFRQGYWNWTYISISWLSGLLRWLFVLSLGVGLFNLLPLPIVDGGRMAQVFLHKLKGKDTGEKRYRQIGLFFLVILLLNLFFPMLVKLF